MARKHIHRWKLTPGIAAKGKCRCGARRRFDGGLPTNGTAYYRIWAPNSERQPNDQDYRDRMSAALEVSR